MSTISSDGRDLTFFRLWRTEPVTPPSSFDGLVIRRKKEKTKSSALFVRLLRLFFVTFVWICSVMASSSTSTGPTGSFTVCQGFNIPISLGHSPEFMTLCKAFDGRSRTAYNNGFQSSPIPSRDTFLRLANKKIPGFNVSVIFSTLDTAIVAFERSSYVTSRDFELLKKLAYFVFDYNLICERQWGLLLDNISIRQKDREGVETQAKADKQLREWAAAKRKEEEETLKRKREEEALFEEGAVRAAEEAEKKHKRSPTRASGSAAASPRQSLFVLAGRDPITGAPIRHGPPGAYVPPPRHTQEIKVSVKELALIRSVKLALDAKERVNWPAHKGLPEHDRLGPDAILD